MQGVMSECTTSANSSIESKKTVSSTSPSDDDDEPTYIPPVKKSAISMDLSSEDNDDLFHFDEPAAKKVSSVPNKWSVEEVMILNYEFWDLSKPSENGATQRVQAKYPASQKCAVVQIKAKGMACYFDGTLRNDVAFFFIVIFHFILLFIYLLHFLYNNFSIVCW